MKSNEALRLIADVSSYQWGMITTAQAEALLAPTMRELGAPIERSTLKNLNTCGMMSAL